MNTNVSIGFRYHWTNDSALFVSNELLHDGRLHPLIIKVNSYYARRIILSNVFCLTYDTSYFLSKSLRSTPFEYTSRVIDSTGHTENCHDTLFHDDISSQVKQCGCGGGVAICYINSQIVKQTSNKLTRGISNFISEGAENPSASSGWDECDPLKIVWCFLKVNDMY